MSWTAALPMLKKALPYLGAITVITGVLGGAYNMGKTHARVEMQAAIVEAANKNKDEITRAVEEALAVQAADHRDALDRAEGRTETITVTEEVIKYVDKIIIDDSCQRLALDFIGMRRQSTDSIRAAGYTESAD